MVIPENIPHELRMRDQWVVWKYTNGTKPPYNAITGELASSTNPATWTSFVNAISVADAWDGVGYVTHETDPYTFIDLDDVDDPILRDKQIAIASYFGSYAETSPSGKGLHIILRGTVPSAIKLPWIEIYSHSRYMTVTGNPWRNTPIQMEHSKLNLLWEQLNQTTKMDGQVVESNVAKETDQEIYARASAARNGQKFVDLWNGEWKKLGYPSASEADFALMNLLTFYSDNFEQCKRMFMSSVAGARPKVWARMQKSDDYLRRMFNRGFDNRVELVNLDKLKQEMNSLLLDKQNKEVVQQNGQHVIEVKPQPTIFIPPPTPKQIPVSINDTTYSLPSGLTGDIARYIYDRSYKPIPEVAIVGALGIMAGLCGRCYNTNTFAGLNLYLLFLGDTGIGKEEMRKGIDSLTNACKMTAPTIDQFKGPATFASGQALVSYLAEHSNCFLSVLNEFGTLWKRLTNPRASGSDQEFIAMLLQLYSMSGKSDVFAKKAFSDSKKNFPDIRSPSFSFIGQSTSQTFLDHINEETIESGFLPRLLIVNYKGGRPRSNYFAATCVPSPDLVKRFSNLVNNVTQMNQRNQVFPIPMDEPAQSRSYEFEIAVDDKINATKNSILRQLWNRAHLNVIKLASLLAVGDNYYKPKVSLQNWEYAEQLVNRNIEEMSNEFSTGIVGAVSAEGAQFNEAIRIIFEYALALSVEPYRKYGMTEEMFEKRVMPYTYFATRLSGLRCFKKEYQPREKVKKILQQLIDNGDIVLIPQVQSTDMFKTMTKMYAIANADIIHRHKQMMHRH